MIKRVFTGLIGTFLVLSCFYGHAQWAFNQPVDGPGSSVLVTKAFTLQFNEKDLAVYDFMGYDIAKLKDCPFLSESGKPMLPFKEIRIALPGGMRAERVLVSGATTQDIAGEFRIFPAQPPRRSGTAPDETAFKKADPNIYGAAGFYPLDLITLVEQPDLAGQSWAVLHAYPVRYTPLSGHLTLVSSITFRIEGTAGHLCGDYLPSRLSDEGFKIYQDQIRRMVLNPDDVVLRTPGSSEARGVDSGSYDYVIITKNDWVDDFQPLADWRTKTGSRANIVTTEWIYSEYTGADNQEKIRSFIIDARTNWGTYYFLIGGEKQTVPFKNKTFYDGIAIPGDGYYSDYDNDWVNEVYVGRLPVDTTDEISDVIDKIFTYEKDPPLTNFAEDILLIGMDLDGATDAEDLKETIDGYIPGTFNVTKVYDSDGGNHKTAAVAALNAGQNMVNHADHGEWNYMGTGDFNHSLGLNNTDVNALTNNGELSIFVSSTCLANKMDHNDYDCIAERLVIHNPDQGGVAFTGNTRVGLYTVGNPDSLSGILDKEWWRGVFQQNQANLGLAIVFAKHQASHNTNAKKHCEYAFNLQGDPAMPFWTADPDNTMTVNYPLAVPDRTSTYLVHVEDGSGDLSGARVCVWKGDEVFEATTTDSNGDASFDISPSTPGVLYMTVTKVNYIPYEGETRVKYTMSWLEKTEKDVAPDLPVARPDRSR